MMWKPIETAPTDGTMVLVYDPGFRETERILMAKWNRTDARWVIAYDGQSLSPTHWMPLPESPLA